MYTIDCPGSNYDLFLVVLFAKTDKLPSSPDFNGDDRSLCVFKLSDINKKLNRATEWCNGVADYRMGTMKNNMWIFKTALGNHCSPVGKSSFFTKCPGIGSTNGVQVIYSSEAVETDHLWEKSGYFNDNQTSFTCFTNVQRQQDDVIQVYGSENGKLYLHSHRYHDSMGYVPIVSLKNDETVKKLEYDAENDLLVALTESKLHVVNFEEFCRSADSCVSCLTRKTLGCGYCSETSQCVFNSTCQSLNWSNSTCVSQVKDIETTLFPKDGTTNFKLFGSDLGCLMPKEYNQKIKVISNNSLDNKDVVVAHCLTVFGIKQEILSCTTLPQEKHFKTPISIKTVQECELDYTVQTVINTTDIHISFVSIFISDYTPKYGSINGGAIVSIYGKFLNAGLNVLVKVSGTECKVIERKEDFINCLMQPQDKSSNNMESFVEIDGYKALFQADFTFLPAPKLILNDDGLNGMYRFVI